MATCFNKLDPNCIPLKIFSFSLVKLTHKDGETDRPEIFRMIALTSCIGKVYHQIKAERLMKFMIDNKYLDSKTQKAF